jgi:hypothetical protein
VTFGDTRMVDFPDSVWEEPTAILVRSENLRRAPIVSLFFEQNAIVPPNMKSVERTEYSLTPSAPPMDSGRRLIAAALSRP